MYIRLANLLKSSFQVLNPGFISGSSSLSGKIPLCCTLNKLSQAKCLFFTRSVSQLTQENESTSDINEKYVHMKGLPYQATTEDIVNFFRPLEIEPLDVIIKRDTWGRPSGIAFAKFKSPDAVKALRNHRNYIGQRYIELSLERGQPNIEVNPQASFASRAEFSTEFHSVHLRGLPYEATTDDIVQFFAPLNIKPSRVQMKYDNFGRPCGMCDCTFDSHEDAVTALKNHKAYIGRRWIGVFARSNFQDVVQS